MKKPLFNCNGVPLKIAALMPLKIDPEKTLIKDALADATTVCDETIVLFDNDETRIPRTDVTEVLRLWRKGPWNDFTNRLTLLARAATYGCQWVMMLDDDERLSPTFTWERAHDICFMAQERGATKVIVRVKTAWNKTHWRTDNIFGMQRKTFFIQNPFMVPGPIQFEFGAGDFLHRPVSMTGPMFWAPQDLFIVHWGLCTRQLRVKNTAKYQDADPENKFSTAPYDYLLDESTLTLEPL